MARTTSHAETTRINAAKMPAPPAMMPDIDYQAIAMASGTTVQALMRASDAMLSGMMALGQEMTAFANARLRENVERSESLLHCTDPAEAFGLHCSFAQKATQHYLEEANRIVSLATEMNGKCWEPIQECTKETLGRIGGNGKAANGGGKAAMAEGK